MFIQHLNIYGERIAVESFDSKITSDLAADFHYFLTPSFDFAEKDVFHLQVLPAKKRPAFWIPVFKTKRSTLFFSSVQERKVCFFEKAWVRYRFEERKCTVYCDTSDIAYETVYMVLLSYAGERLDTTMLHRIHGMGFTFRGKGAILLAPSGGGKSTLALELIKRKEFGLLSDDTPILTKQGKMKAFPQRIATKESPEVDKKFVRTFKRVEHGEKYVIGGGFFEEKIEPEAKVDWLLLMDSERTAFPQVDESARLSAIWPLFKWLVIGYETPQIWELYLRGSRQDLKEKAKIFARRCRVAGELLLQARVARVCSSSDPKKTEEAVIDFLNRKNLS